MNPIDALDECISIHAPVKGATPQIEVHRGAQPISIHAPVKGATWIRVSRHLTRPDFNPRSREGSDGQTQCYRHLHYISIHAPVKGATSSLRA